MIYEDFFDSKHLKAMDIKKKGIAEAPAQATKRMKNENIGVHVLEKSFKKCGKEDCLYLLPFKYLQRIRKDS